GLKMRAVEAHNQLSRQDEALRTTLSEAKLATTVAEQQAHLDALNERLSFMSDTERSLRALLLDAHSQLLQRDHVIAAQAQPQAQLQAQAQAVAAQQQQLEQRQRDIESLVSHIEHVTREYHARCAAIDELKAELDASHAALDAERRASRAA